jgi:O-antigen/teichoic acid export membrane protein
VNLIQLAANSLIGLVLPPVLIHRLTRDMFSAWMLIVQISMYINYFDLGIQSAVAYFVAFTEERGESRLRDSYVSSAIALLGGLALLGFGTLFVFCWILPDIFTGMTAELLPRIRPSILLVGFSMAVMLPTSALSAIFIGRQRSEISAGISVIGRLISAGLILAVVLHQPDLFRMAAAIALSNLLVSALVIKAWKSSALKVSVDRKLVSREPMKRLIRYCFGLSVWTVSGLLIAGLDIFVVGIVEFRSIGYYAVATSVTMLLVQIQSAVMRALMPAATVLNARSDRNGLNRVLLNSTRYGTLLLCWIGIPLIILARPLMRVWVGGDFASHTFPILQILLFANMVRLTCLPYATVVMGTNQQNKIAAVGIAEGLINLVSSVILGHRFGAIGVAFGTLIGSFSSVLMHLTYSIGVTDAVSVTRRQLLNRGFLLPSLSFFPWLLLWRAGNGMTSRAYFLMQLLGSVLAITLTWATSIASEERRRILTFFSRVLSKAEIDKPPSTTVL